MRISFKTKKLSKELTTDKGLAKRGARQAALIKRRLVLLEAATFLADLGPPYAGPARCHELKGNRVGQLSVDLDHPFRLLFIPDHKPPPTRPEGGLDWSQVTAVTIIGVEDTHG